MISHRMPGAKILATYPAPLIHSSNAWRTISALVGTAAPFLSRSVRGGCQPPHQIGWGTALAADLRLSRPAPVCTVQLALAFLEVKMATKITVVLEDDIQGGPAEETLRFGLDGREYEIDLNSTNAAAFRQQIAPYLEHARRAGSRPLQRPVRTAASRERSADIRAWAKDNGIAVSERGRIPANVIQQYETATGNT